MRVTDYVGLVGSGANGFGLSHSTDCHVWAIDAGPDDLVLIDSGAGVDVDPILRNLEALHLLGRRTTILVTHAHADHAGGAGPLGEVLGASVAASAEVAQIIDSGDQVAASVDVGMRAGSYPDGYCLPRGQVDRHLSDGEPLVIGDCVISAISTPGHAVGHMCFLLERDGRRDLFTGDAVLFNGRIIVQDTWDCDLREQIVSLQKLAQNDFQGFFPGHFSFSVTDGHRHVDAALAPLKQGGVPPIL